MGGCRGRMLRAGSSRTGAGGTRPVTSRDSRVASLPPVERETAPITHSRQLNGIYSVRHGKSRQKGGDAGGSSCPSLPEPVRGRQVPSSGNGTPLSPVLGIPRGIPRLQQELHSPTEHFLWASVGRRLFQVESSTLGDAFKHIIRATCRGIRQPCCPLEHLWSPSGGR